MKSRTPRFKKTGSVLREKVPGERLAGQEESSMDKQTSPLQNPRYRAVLFDLDGTLTCSHPGILGSVKLSLQEMGLPGSAAGNAAEVHRSPFGVQLHHLLRHDPGAGGRRESGGTGFITTGMAFFAVRFMTAFLS